MLPVIGCKGQAPDVLLRKMKRRVLVLHTQQNAQRVFREGDLPGIPAAMAAHGIFHKTTIANAILAIEIIMKVKADKFVGVKPEHYGHL
jgi:hypothetical protein